MGFKIPPKVHREFDTFLDTAGIEEQVFDCEVIHDWLNQDNIETERIEMYTPDAKSYYDNSDNRVDCRFKRQARVNKGDIIKTNNGEYYILDWRVLQEINNRATRALRANDYLSIYRRFKEQVDERGVVIKEAGERLIVHEQPVNIIQNQTNITNTSGSSTSPGINPEVMLNVVCQYNDETKDVRINDYFEFGVSTYVIVNINYTGLDIDKRFGTLVIQAKKKPGGEDFGRNNN